MGPSFQTDLEKILAAVTRTFAQEGNAAAVAVLACSTPTLEQSDYDTTLDGPLYGYILTLEISEDLYRQLLNSRNSLAEAIATRFNSLTPQYRDEKISSVAITPALTDDPNWRDKARVWIAGAGVSNQGRARSDNLAPRMADGLLFRSQPEINLYRALKALGISFAPLPVFVRGGETYRRIEPDFVILKDGILLIVEVDGDTVHRETPAEAHDRTTMLAYEGALVERVNASECDTPEKAKDCARKILGIINKLKANK